MITALTGKDTIKINGRILNDFIDGDTAYLKFPNEKVQAKTGKNGNNIFAYNYTGKICDLTLRLIRNGADDIFLNNLNFALDNNPPGFSLMTGEFTKNVGDGSGNIKGETYVMSGGIFKKNPEVKENADGETEQAVVVWELLFTNSPRSIGT